MHTKYLLARFSNVSLSNECEEYFKDTNDLTEVEDIMSKAMDADNTGLFINYETDNIYNSTIVKHINNIVY